MGKVSTCIPRFSSILLNLSQDAPQRISRVRALRLPHCCDGLVPIVPRPYHWFVSVVSRRRCLCNPQTTRTKLLDPPEHLGESPLGAHCPQVSHLELGVRGVTKLGAYPEGQLLHKRMGWCAPWMHLRSLCLLSWTPPCLRRCPPPRRVQAWAPLKSSCAR